MITHPFPLGSDAFVIPSFWQTPGAPVGVHMNSMVLRSEQPVLFDTSVAIDREAWLDTVFGLVDPAEVRWVILSHDDPDHVGNLAPVLDACPNATVVATWFLTERLGPELALDPRRLRWVGPGETLDIGDRTLRFVRPPLYDSPTTRAVFDPVSRVLWAADLFATPAAEPIDDAAQLPAEVLAEGFFQFQQWNSPWYALLDPARYEAEVKGLAAFDIAAIASTHGPAFLGPMVDRAFELLRAVPHTPAAEQPGQAQLDEIVAAIMTSAPAGAAAS